MAIFFLLAASLLTAQAPDPKEAEDLVTSIREVEGSYVVYEGREASPTSIVTLHLAETGELANILPKLNLLPKLRTFSYSGSIRFSDENAKILPELPALEELVLRFAKITDAAIPLLAKRCKRLRKLDVSGTGITDAGIMDAKLFPLLEDLNCSGTKVTLKSSGACLTDLQMLRKLDLAYLAIGDDCLAGVSSLSELTELNLYRTPIADAGLEHLTKLTQLRILNLGSTKCTPKCFEHLSKCSSLESLKFSLVKISGPELSDLKKCPKLHALHFTHLRLTDEDIDRIAEIKTITELNFTSASGITDKGIGQCAKLPELRVLVLPAGITDKGLETLTSCSRLQQLSLFGTSVTSQGMKHLDSFPLLTDLNLSFTKIDDDALPFVARRTRLQQLNLAHTSITEKSLKHLAALTVLAELNIGSNKINDDALPMLAKMPMLQKLNLFEDNISDKGLEALHGLKHLQWLMVAKTKVTEAGRKAVQKAIPGISVSRIDL